MNSSDLFGTVLIIKQRTDNTRKKSGQILSALFFVPLFKSNHHITASFKRMLLNPIAHDWCDLDNTAYSTEGNVSISLKK